MNPSHTATFDEMVLGLGVPTLLRHAAEAHERETAKLKEELNALRRFLGEAAAACVADIRPDLASPAPVLSTPPSCTMLTPHSAPKAEPRATTASSFAAIPRTQPTDSQRARRPSKCPPTLLTGAASSKLVFEACGFKEIVKLSDQVKRLEEVLKIQSAEHIAQIGTLKLHQLMQQVEIERVRTEMGANEEATTGKTSPSRSLVSSPRRLLQKVRQGKPSDDVHQDRSSGSTAVSTPVMDSAVGSSGTAAGTDAGVARAAMITYEEAFPRAQLRTSTAAGDPPCPLSPQRVLRVLPGATSPTSGTAMQRRSVSSNASARQTTESCSPVFRAPRSLTPRSVPQVSPPQVAVAPSVGKSTSLLPA